MVQALYRSDDLTKAAAMIGAIDTIFGYFEKADIEAEKIRKEIEQWKEEI